MSEISLDKFAKGAMRELVNKELSRVAANIADPNTSSAAKRTVTITISVSPDENRQTGNVVIAAKSTLCPVKGVNTKLILGYDETNKIGEFSEFDTSMFGQVSVAEMEEYAAEKAESREGKVIDLRQPLGGM